MEALTELSNTTNTTAETIKPADWEYELARIGLLITAALIIVANLLSLAVFHFMAVLENMTGVFIKSLAAADLGVGICVLISVQAQLGVKWPFDLWSCNLVGYVLAVMVCVSILSLTCVSIDRYVAIIKPLEYRFIVTKHRARIYAVLVWMFGAAIFLPSLFDWGGLSFLDSYARSCKGQFTQNLSFSFSIVCLLILPAMIISVYCYYHILRACLAQRRQTRRLEMLFRETETTTRPHERMLAKIFLIVISAFYISWLPFVIRKIIEMAADARVNPGVNFLTTWLGFLNSFLNCVIYFIGHRSFRDGFRQLFKAMWVGMTSLCALSKERCFDRRRGRTDAQPGCSAE